jgi:hypothetical protein
MKKAANKFDLLGKAFGLNGFKYRLNAFESFLSFYFKNI